MFKSNESDKITFGIISDTHGSLPAGIHKVFEAVDGILHAGDIGDESILDELRMIAPVVAVRGNMDWGDWALRLPGNEILTAGSLRVGMVHDPFRLPVEILEANCHVIVNGHTHKALVEEKKGVLYVNPGSAGQPRANRPATVALLRINGQRAAAEIIPLESTSR